jgi:hypothetical protein
MTMPDVLDMQNPGFAQGAVVVETDGISGKIKLYA